MKKKIVLTLSALLVMALSVPALAAPWGHYGGPGYHGPGYYGPGYYGPGYYGPGYYTEPTAEQKAEIDKMNKLFFEERKQMIERRVEWGYMSRAEADSLISYLQERMQNNPGVPLYGYGNRHGGHHRGGYGGGRGGCGGCW